VSLSDPDTSRPFLVCTIPQGQLKWGRLATILGRVLPPLASVRGPDGCLRVDVDPSWLRGPGTLELTLPRHVTCAACDGGGCSVCGFSGALALRDRDAPAELVSIGLSDLATDTTEGTEPTRRLAVRLPEYGAPSAVAGVGRGQLLVTLMASTTPSANVRYSGASRRSLPSLPDLVTRSLCPEGRASRARCILIAALVTLGLALGALLRLLP